ncbi:DUF6319 family protein [Gordonia soli]|uniref:Translation initiation factor n=1 Tax=Gordonia soli NBRC 108243 TaxID=1223545 RepID=M0QNI0_9ACTN|nr:DUF6319 family protein [Gordonia soli]GAC70220.1 hypothetical protein GS4_33_00340 [Gordonia soli NBRC 108243]
MYGVSARRATGLTPDDLETLSTGLAAGKRVTVYLRDPMPSLGLDAGASARVVSIDGNTVTVSPKGVDDELPFEADELQKNRAATTTTPAAAPRRQPPRSVTAPVAAPPTEPRPTAAKKSAPRPVATPAPDPTEARSVESAPAPAKTARRPKASVAAAVSVTITSTGESSWIVSVAHGAKKQGKPTEVTADRVARAVRELGDETAVSAVDGVIDSAREAAQKRISELSQELEAARAALANLDGQATAS